ncbi:MAG: hypothetical protein IJM27_02630 [Eubacterium sp.]|nr:hypothetical protein [Eubacterium sp.]
MVKIEIILKGDRLSKHKKNQIENELDNLFLNNPINRLCQIKKSINGNMIMYEGNNNQNDWQCLAFGVMKLKLNMDMGCIEKVLWYNNHSLESTGDFIVEEMSWFHSD